MFWNWDVRDVCFISRRWRIRSAATFAGMCILVVLLAIAHEYFRYLSKSHDRRLIGVNMARRATF